MLERLTEWEAKYSRKAAPALSTDVGTIMARHLSSSLRSVFPPPLHSHLYCCCCLPSGDARPLSAPPPAQQFPAMGHLSDQITTPDRRLKVMMGGTAALFITGLRASVCACVRVFVRAHVRA